MQPKTTKLAVPYITFTTLQGAKAAEKLLKGPPLNRPIHIYTDSKSAINAIDNHTIKSTIVKQCIATQ